VCVERGHSGQNRNDLGQLPNASIVLQEVVGLWLLLLCCVGVCCSVVVVGVMVVVLWSAVGEVWERTTPVPF
jgi:hypothetical protein